jgi:diguanylate cyclase (GGDEF)-like protein
MSTSIRDAGHGAAPMTADPARSALGFRSGLGVFLDRLREGRNLFHALTEALARGLGWRFAAVTRFTERPGVVQMLGWWTGDRFEAPFEYELAHTPCERVAQHEGFCYFDDVAAMFPRDAMALELGVVTYGGQVYRDADGRPLGHLLAAHDRAGAAATEVRALFDLLVLVMGLELKHLSAHERLVAADQAARTDPLTGLGNRRAFDAALAQRALDRPLADLIAVIDLDGLKRVNDLLGHAAGDALLVAFARALKTRLAPHDHLYRLGGDEFALLAQGAPCRIERTLDAALDETRAALAARPELLERGFGPALIDASYGIADPRHHDWNLTQAIAEADRRMYAHKHARRAA